MKTNEAIETTETAAVAEQGAHVAPEKAPTKKTASPKKGAPKSEKKAKGGKAKAAAPKTEAKVLAGTISKVSPALTLNPDVLRLVSCAVLSVVLTVREFVVLAVIRSIRPASLPVSILAK